MSTKSVLDLFGSLKGLLKLEKVCTDNLMFRLHYKVTVIIFVICCVMVTARQYIGEPIHCIVDKLPQKYVDTYCWIHPTYTIPVHFKGQMGKHVVKTGVGPEVRGQHSRQYHNYYQWVCFVLFFQSVLFYLPRQIWKNWEGGLMKNLTEKSNSILLTDKEKEESKKHMLKHCMSYLHKQNSYAFKFVFCEILNLVNVVLQVILMNQFLGGQFTTYGLRVFSQAFTNSELRDDPLNEVFPKLTKCELFKYGPSGNIENHDSLCVLPLNIVNEKIYILIWFWCLILTLFSTLFLLYRFVTLCSTKTRKYLLRSQSYIGNSNASFAQDVENVINNFYFGDWFVLMQLGKNVNPIVYVEFISDLAEKFGGTKKCKRSI